MKFFKKRVEENNNPKGFVVLSSEGILEGSIEYDDVPKYMSAITMWRSQDANEIADIALSKMVETGHPLALTFKANDLINEGKVTEGTKIIEKAIESKDVDSLIDYASWILLDRIKPDCVDEALNIMADMAERGYRDRIIVAPGYFLRNIAKGLDQKENNIKLNEWIEIWNPKLFKKYEKGRVSQDEVLGPISRACGLEKLD